jgi:hypothetical protein
MAEIKTDNSYLVDKIALRANHLPAGDVTVLDCFAGKGLIWNGVVARTGRRIRRLPIDIRNSKNFHLPGDNRSYLQTIDLKRFNVIDLDAYGVPFAQLEIVFQRGYAGTVFCTFIQSVVGALPHGMLMSLGYTPEMLGKCPTLFFRDGYEKFKQYLAQRGVRRLWERTHARKNYVGFVL